MPRSWPMASTTDCPVRASRLRGHRTRNSPISSTAIGILLAGVVLDHDPAGGDVDDLAPCALRGEVGESPWAGRRPGRRPGAGRRPPGRPADAPGRASSAWGPGCTRHTTQPDEARAGVIGASPTSARVRTRQAIGGTGDRTRPTTDFAVAGRSRLERPADAPGWRIPPRVRTRLLSTILRAAIRRGQRRPRDFRVDRRPAANDDGRALCPLPIDLRLP